MEKTTWQEIFKISDEDAEEMEKFSNEKKEARWQEIEKEWVNK